VSAEPWQWKSGINLHSVEADCQGFYSECRESYAVAPAQFCSIVLTLRAFPELDSTFALARWAVWTVPRAREFKHMLGLSTCSSATGKCSR